jgi:hypothetical protein
MGVDDTRRESGVLYARWRFVTVKISDVNTENIGKKAHFE